MSKQIDILEGLKGRKVNEFSPEHNPQGQMAAMIAKGDLKKDKNGKLVEPKEKKEEEPKKTTHKINFANFSKGGKDTGELDRRAVLAVLKAKQDEKGYDYFKIPKSVESKMIDDMADFMTKNKEKGLSYEEMDDYADKLRKKYKASHQGRHNYGNY